MCKPGRQSVDSTLQGFKFLPGDASALAHASGAGESSESLRAGLVRTRAKYAQGIPSDSNSEVMQANPHWNPPGTVTGKHPLPAGTRGGFEAASGAPPGPLR